MKDFRIYSFMNIMIEGWNELPEEVIEANSIEEFNNRYDGHKN